MIIWLPNNIIFLWGDLGWVFVFQILQSVSNNVYYVILHCKLLLSIATNQINSSLSTKVCGNNFLTAILLT